MTQLERLARYLRTHPGASSRDIAQTLDIMNTTGRISDLRKRGVDVQCRREAGVDRYYVVDHDEQTTMGLVA